MASPPPLVAKVTNASSSGSVRVSAPAALPPRSRDGRSQSPDVDLVQTVDDEFTDAGVAVPEIEHSSRTAAIEEGRAAAVHHEDTGAAHWNRHVPPEFTVELRARRREVSLQEADCIEFTPPCGLRFAPPHRTVTFPPDVPSIRRMSPVAMRVVAPPYTDHCGDTVFPSENRSVGQHSAVLRDDAECTPERGRPARVDGADDEYVVPGHGCEIRGFADHSGATFDNSGRTPYTVEIRCVATGRAGPRGRAGETARVRDALRNRPVAIHRCAATPIAGTGAEILRVPEPRRPPEASSAVSQNTSSRASSTPPVSTRRSASSRHTARNR